MDDLMIPVLNPSGVQEILDYGIYGIELSRISGCWIGIKCVHDNVSSAATVDLNEDRVSLIDIEKNLKDYFGISKVIWLKHGTDEGTDGHIDNVACFTEPGVVSAMVCSDKNDSYYEILNENLETLKTSTDSRGNRLKIIEIEMSYQRLVPGSDEPCSYINYYIANNGIIMPIYNDLKADEAAVNQIKSAFPNRKVVCIDGHDIHLGGGNVHCITQQQPKGHV